MRPINKIVIHCSATPPDQDIGVTEIRDWHTRGNGWSDVGYHYIIKRSGDKEKGRAEETKGAHAKGYNHDSLGICLVGGIDDNKRPDFNFTRDQLAALEVLVSELKHKYPDADIMGHRDLEGVAKACPCFNVTEWWNAL